MPKKAKKTNSNCQQHLFLLRPNHNYCRFNQAVCISFCDQLKDKNKTKPKKCRNISCLDCPIFNKDKNFATPTFILNSEKKYYEERGQRMRDQHQKKMIEYTDQKDSLNIPKPRTKNNFCSVCRQVYEDYLQHIQSQRHKKKINTSHFNRYILDIAEKFNPNSKNLINYSYQTQSTRFQDDVEIIQKPMKKIKTDPYYNERFLIYQDMMKTNMPPPPPHLNLNHSGYFPRFTQQLNLMQNQIHPLSMNPSLNPPLTFNYNMNIFMNPYHYNYFPPNFNLFNPMMEYRSNNMVNNLNPMPFPRMEPPPNYYIPQSSIKIQKELMQKGNPLNYYPAIMNPMKQLKRQSFLKQKSQIIVIDDDENYPNDNYQKNQ